MDSGRERNTDGDPWSWETWAFELREHYFSRNFAGEPVTLSVDREELEVIAKGRLADPVDSLSAAVRSQVMPNFRFGPVRRATDRWFRNQQREENPEALCPSLPLLALNVLAASEMTSSGGQGAPNFYVPLRRMLGDDVGVGAPGDYSNHVPACWESLNSWLDDVLGGERGFSTITKHEHFTLIGYATQQAVLRVSDRRRLPRFFRAVGVEPGEEIVPSELRNALAIWARRQGQVGARLHRFATEHREYADRLLPVLVERWDGKILHERTGAKAEPLRLWLQQGPPVQLGLAAVSPVTTEDLVSDLERRVEPLLVNGIEGKPISPVPLPVPVDSSILELGLSLQGEEMALYLEPADAFLLRRISDFYPAWTSTQSLRFGERHILLVRADRHRPVLDWLHAEGATDAKVAASATPSLPPGWLLIVGIELAHHPSSNPPPEVADLIRASGGTRMRLEGGLKLMHRTYLTFGAPLLLLPNGENPTFSIEFEGKAVERDGSQPFALHEITRWDGEYAIRHALGELRLTACEEWSQVPGAGVGSVKHRSESSQGVAGLDAEVVPPPGPSVISTSGQPGEILVAADGAMVPVRHPGWLPFMAGTPWLTAWAGSAPVWRLEPTEDGGHIARLLEPLKPKLPAVGNGHSLVAKARFPDDETDAAFDLWCEYQDAAGV